MHSVTAHTTATASQQPNLRSSLPPAAERLISQMEISTSLFKQSTWRLSEKTKVNPSGWPVVNKPPLNFLRQAWKTTFRHEIETALVLPSTSIYKR
jgi:hypothetical protein